jgi:hypothetical protein
MICRQCYCQITELWESGRVVYVVDDGQTTSADGLTYCPPNPDFPGEFRDHAPRPEGARDVSAGV